MPVLVHCVHGKDRTGLIVMLIYLVCGVPHDIIIADYAQSESLLRESRDHKELMELPEELTRDQIIASAASVMEGTIAHITRKYGDVDAYLCSTGMVQEEIDGIRAKLKRNGHGPNSEFASSSHETVSNEQNGSENERALLFRKDT